MALSPAVINDFKNRKTPFYYYDLELLEKTLEIVKSEAGKYGYHLHYAMKANVNEKIMKTIQKHGLGVDCVSGNEVLRALEMGYKPEEVVFAGVGKSDDEIIAALENDIFSFNCESTQEIEVINELAEKLGKKAKIAVRLNPDVNANTHKNITTGLKDNKFGINMYDMDSVLEVLEKCPNVSLIGLHFHIGSQILDLSAYKNLCVRVNQIQEWFFSRHIKVEFINVGGGLGIDYHAPENNISDFETYFSIFNQFLELRPGQELHFELGRSIVGQCGSLISRVLYMKKAATTEFMILDAGMSNLIRPMLYQAHHQINNLTAEKGEMGIYDIVGPICESTDTFGRAVEIEKTKRGDLIEIMSCGAYGEVMASDYNLKPCQPAVYSDELVVEV